MGAQQFATRSEPGNTSSFVHLEGSKGSICVRIICCDLGPNFEPITWAWAGTEEIGEHIEQVPTQHREPTRFQVHLANFTYCVLPARRQEGPYTTTNGIIFDVTWGKDYTGVGSQDLINATTISLEACINLCAYAQECLGAGWGGSPVKCWLKSQLGSNPITAGQADYPFAKRRELDYKRGTLGPFIKDRTWVS